MGNRGESRLAWLGRVVSSLFRCQLKIECGYSRCNHFALSRARKKKTPATGAQTALLVFAVLAAGGIASFTFVHFNSREKNVGATTPTVSSSNTTPTAATNEGVPDIFKWLAEQTNAADLLNFGTSLLEKGRTEESVLCYRRALELNATDEEIHFNLGVAYARLGQLEAAAEQYREALKLVPEYSEAHNNLGNVLTRQKRYTEAIAAFQEALKVSPDNALAHNNLGRVLGEQGQLNEALSHFAEALRLDPNYAEAHFNLGAAYLTLGRTNDAIAALNAALRVRPDFPPALQMLARLRSNSR